MRNIAVSTVQKLVEQIAELPAENRVAGKGESACYIPYGVGTLFSVGGQDANADPFPFKACTSLTLA